MSHPETALPNIDRALFKVPSGTDLTGVANARHAPRFLLLYGSLRERSYSRFVTEEAAQLLTAMGGDVRIFDPSDLPQPDTAPETHPKVAELLELAQWAEAMVWTSPERHGAMMGIMICTPKCVAQ